MSVLLRVPGQSRASAAGVAEDLPLPTDDHRIGAAEHLITDADDGGELRDATGTPQHLPLHLELQVVRGPLAHRPEPQVAQPCITDAATGGGELAGGHRG